MQRGHSEVAKQFALNFDGKKTRVGDLEFEVTEASISSATGIPILEENWFKAMVLSSPFVKDIFNLEYQANDLSKNVSKNQLIDQFDRMLKIIQRYFSCERRFNTLYHYHIRLLLHFTGKVQMNIPYYLLRSIGKMADRVQAKSKDMESSLFHSGLIRMLVSKELGKKEISWENFLVSSHFKLDPTPTPQSQIAGSSSPTSTKIGIDKKRKGRAPVSEINKKVREVEEEVCPSPHRDFSPPHPPGLEEVPSSTKVISKKGKKLLFPSPSPATEIKGKRPFTRSSIPKGDFKGNPLQETPIQKIKGKGTKRPLEREDEIPVKDCKKPMKNKEKVVVQKKKHKRKGFEKIDETCKETSVQMEEKDEKKPAETTHVPNPLGSQTYKRLIKQLRDGRREIARLKAEDMVHLAQMNELMTGYNHTLDLARFIEIKALPLHKQLKNLYR
jgi:hypothetical protein